MPHLPVLVYVSSGFHVRTYADASFHITIQARSTNTRFTYVQSSTIVHRGDRLGSDNVMYIILRTRYAYCFYCCTLHISWHIPGMLHLEREARDWSTYNEYSFRIILLLLYVYCSRAHPHFPSQFRRRRLQDFFTSSANSPKSWWEGNLLFMRKASTFLKTYFRKHSKIYFKCGRLDVCKSGVCGAGLNRNME